jgi:hypothetical protein
MAMKMEIPRQKWEKPFAPNLMNGVTQQRAL